MKSILFFDIETTANPDAIALPVAFQDRTATLVNLKNSGTIERNLQQKATVVDPLYMG